MQGSHSRHAKTLRQNPESVNKSIAAKARYSCVSIILYGTAVDELYSCTVVDVYRTGSRTGCTVHSALLYSRTRTDYSRSSGCHDLLLMCAEADRLNVR
jgi:hypothetical protein